TTGSDIQLGSLLSTISGYAVGSATGAGDGIVGVSISHSGSTFYTHTAGGHLIDITFHVLQTAASSVTPPFTTLVDVMPDAQGDISHQTFVVDQAGNNYPIRPSLTMYSGNLT